MEINEKDILIREFQEVISISELARNHGVSRQAMHQKIRKYGILDKWRRRARRNDVKQAYLLQRSLAGKSGRGACKSHPRNKKALNGPGEALI